MATPQASTLSKGLVLLSAIARDGGRSSLTEIARALSLPLATAHRLAATLEVEGYLLRLKRGYFTIGPVATALGASPDLEHLTATRLRAGLARLARRHGAFAHFGVLDDGMVTYLVKAGGTGAALFTEERMQLEAYCSAIGKVALAALPDDDLDAYLAAGPFVALTGRTLTDPNAIRAEVEATRASEVGYDRCEIREDLYCMAVPVKTPEGNWIGAISLSLLGPVPEPSRQKTVIRDLRRLARQAR
ncbi:MAG: IclR family transcriptional regulator [Sphingomonadales bacterium]|nr:IclR family transcriptional regulator [Sphingomonadales bacterium]